MEIQESEMHFPIHYTIKWISYALLMKVITWRVKFTKVVERDKKQVEYLIHFHQESEGKVNLGIDSSENHYLLVPRCMTAKCQRYMLMQGYFQAISVS